MIERRAEVSEQRTMILGAQAIVADFVARTPVHAVQNFLEMIDPSEPGSSRPGDARGMEDVRGQVWKSIDKGGRKLTYKDYM